MVRGHRGTVAFPAAFPLSFHFSGAAIIVTTCVTFAHSAALLPFCAPFIGACVAVHATLVPAQPVSPLDQLFLPPQFCVRSLLLTVGRKRTEYLFSFLSEVARIVRRVSAPTLAAFLLAAPLHCNGSATPQVCSAGLSVSSVLFFFTAQLYRCWLLKLP